MYIYELNSNNEIINQPRCLLPYALLTFERNKLLNHDTSSSSSSPPYIRNELLLLNGNDDDDDDTSNINIFDIDSKLNMNGNFMKSDDEDKYNLSKSRVYYEHTGRINVKFRGMSKLKIKLTDILRSNMKFLDEEKTSISLTNSTNRLLLTYMDKRTAKAAIQVTTTTNSVNQIKDLKQNHVIHHTNGNGKRALADGLGSNTINSDGKKQAISVNHKPMPVPSKQIKNEPQQPTKLVNKKVFSQNVLSSTNSKQIVKKEAPEVAKQQINSKSVLNKSISLTTTTTAAPPQAITSLNSSSTSLEMHLMKSRKSLSTTLATNANKMNQITKQQNTQQQQQQKIQQTNRFSLTEVNKKREQYQQKFIKQFFWSGDEWKRMLNEASASYFKQHYEQIKVYLDSDIEKFNIIFESISINGDTMSKIDVNTIQKIELYNPKIIYTGGFNGIEAGKCGTNMRNELHQQHASESNKTRGTLIMNAVKKIQLNEYASKIKPFVMSNNNEELVVPTTIVPENTSQPVNISVTASSIQAVEPLNKQPVELKTTPLNIKVATVETPQSSQPQETTPLENNRQYSSSSSLNVNNSVIVKEEPHVHNMKSTKTTTNTKHSSMSLIEEVKKNLSKKQQSKTMSDSENDSNSRIHSTESHNNNNNNSHHQHHHQERMVLKRKHKSRKLTKQSKHSKKRSPSNDSSMSSNNSYCVNSNKMKKKKRKKSKKHSKIHKKKSRSSSFSSISSSISYSSSSSASISTGISYSSSLSAHSKHIRLEEQPSSSFNITTPNSSSELTKISISSSFQTGGHSSSNPGFNGNNEFSILNSGSIRTPPPSLPTPDTVTNNSNAKDDTDSYYDSFYNEYDLSIQSLVAASSSHSHPTISNSPVTKIPPKSVTPPVTVTTQATASNALPSQKQHQESSAIVDARVKTEPKLLATPHASNVARLNQQTNQINEKIVKSSSHVLTRTLKNNIQAPLQKPPPPSIPQFQSNSRFRINNSNLTSQSSFVDRFVQNEPTMSSSNYQQHCFNPNNNVPKNFFIPTNNFNNRSHIIKENGHEFSKSKN